MNFCKNNPLLNLLFRKIKNKVMNNAIFTFEKPKNEEVKKYLPGSDELKLLEAELKRQSSMEIEIPMIIGGQEIRTGNIGKVVMPHDHSHVLATYHLAGENEIQMAIEAAKEAKRKWERISWLERASIMLKIAELISKKYRNLLNAATMLGQSKNIYQAEIDAACETIDFLRFNAYLASRVYSAQPFSTETQINRLEYRALEGFVFAVSPFNFTSIASNLALAPALMGNTVVWKPATTALLSNYYLMQIYKEAGLPDGVVNFIPSKGSDAGNVVLAHRDFAGLHFTGSNSTFNILWKKIAQNLENYKSYPRIVGETGGKDFVFVHKSAKPIEVATLIVAGAFEYQGQKCSAASRAYIPESLWIEIKSEIQRMLSEIKIGSPVVYQNFVNAVIDKNAFDRIMSYIEEAKYSPDCQIISGGNGDDSKGYFIEPTIILTKNPNFKTMQEEIFGPVMTIYVYPDDKYSETLELCDETSPYGLTGSIFSNDKYATVEACAKLRHAAGNFYINDKPTGAVVGLQPFGGARASGTNDKAGGHFNLMRWTSPRTLKETFIPPTDYRYDYMK
jgi:1-pyrroline-5-carboxylate dehydrogenase